MKTPPLFARFAAMFLALLCAAIAPAHAQITVGGNGTNTTDSTSYSGAQSLTKIGSNTVTMTGDSTYTGGTTINAGALAIGANNRLPDVGQVTINSGGVFDLGGFGEYVGSLTMNGNATVSGSSSLGQLILTTGLPTNSAIKTLTANGAGNIVTAGIGISSSHGGVGGNSDLRFNVVGASDNLALSGVINDKSSDGGGTATRGAISKAGQGTLLLLGTNTYTGRTSILEGTVVAANSKALGAGGVFVDTMTTVSAGATLALQGNISMDEHMHIFGSGVGGLGAIRNLSGSNALTATGYALRSDVTLGADAGQLTISGAIGQEGGAYGMTKVGAGTLLLSGVNTYSGGTRVNAGTLVIGAGGTLLNIGTDLTANNGGTITFARRDVLGLHTDSIAMPVVLNEGGLLQNSGAVFNTLGALNLNGGTLQANDVEPGSGQSFALKGAVTVTGNATSTIAGNGIALGAAAVTGTTFNVGDGASETDLLVTGVLRDGSGATFGPAQVSSLTKTGAGAMVLAGSNAYTGTTTISAGTLQVGNGGTSGNLGTGNVTNNAALVFNRSDSHSVSNVISGTGSLTKNGTGTTTLVGTNTYTGGTTIAGGTLQVGNGGTAGSLGSGDVTNNSTLAINRGNAYTLGNIVSGTGGLVQLGAGTTTLTSSNTYTGGTTVSAGTLALGSANRLADSGALAVNGGNFNLGGFSETVGAVTLGGGSITNGTLTGSSYDVQSGNVSAVLAGSGALTKSTAGTTTLSGANTFTGGTTVNAGRLATSGNERLADSGAVTVNTNGTFAIGGDETIASLAGAGAVELGGRLTTGANNSTYSGSMSGLGGLTKSGAGTFTLSGASTYAGDTILAAGTLVLNNANALWTGGVLSMDAGTTLTVNQRTFIGALDQNGGTIDGPGQLVATLTLTESGALNAVLADGPDFAAGILKRTSGTTTIGAANTFTGGINVQGGTLVLGAGGSFDAASSLALSAGATMDLGNKAQTFSLLNGQGGTVAMGSGALTVNGSNDSQFAGSITGTGSFTKAGSGVVTLSGTSTYTGGTAISGGTLQVGNGGTNGTLGTGAVTNNGSLVFNRSDNHTVANAMSGNGALTKLGGGTTTLTADNAVAGTTTIGEGTLQVGDGGTSGSLGTGAVVNNGSLAFNRSDNHTVANTMSGSGETVKSGAGVMTLTGNNTATGTTTVNAGTLQVGNGGTSGAVGGNIVNNGAVAFNRSDAATYGGAITGTGSVSKQGAGRLALTGTSTYSGATTVDAGELNVTGSADNSTVTVNSGATLSGSGSIGGLIVNSGGTINPGNSPGTQTVAGNATWNAGANYNWQILDAAGTAGSAWDLLNVTGTLDLSALSLGNEFEINLWSLSSTGPDVSGNALNFNSAQNYTWTIASAATGITGFTGTSQFSINTGANNGAAGFANALNGGSFSIAQSGNDLNLVFTAAATPPGPTPVPEPGTWAAAALLAGGAYLRWRKRRQAQG